MNYSLITKKKFHIYNFSYFFQNKLKINNIKNNSYITKRTYNTTNGEFKNVLSQKIDDKNNHNFPNMKYKAVNSQPKKNLSVFGYNRGKFFVSIKKDFTSFVVNTLIISVFLYSVYTLAPNETISQRRRRIITERLMKEYELTDKDLEMIEEYDEIIEK
ncbi:conserved protein, unknown function [Plasmodium gaboni]|uniref:Uncharacterized protein n=1 Tax=Plasmodium gaboni TaxID=647221 RepID=A0A151LLB2_9APIC|nr:conserved protein, unknown function [Plasmodium gaboni]KYO00013.1 conserved protein, unknown function [Plasmodium gaboni]SOV13861.1 conserved protein, unknown function [Plasmodium gaboni]